MDIEELKNYKIKESSVINETDVKHIANYKQLIKFFENTLQEAISAENDSLKTLHSSYIQSIRFLENLIFTYESSLQGANFVNKTIDRIIEENSPVGNEESTQKLEKLESQEEK